MVCCSTIGHAALPSTAAPVPVSPHLSSAIRVRLPSQILPSNEIQDIDEHPIFTDVQRFKIKDFVTKYRMMVDQTKERGECVSTVQCSVLI